MADQIDDGTKTLDSFNSGESPGVVFPPTSPEEEIPHSSATHFNNDLKSVLVTSVLNLEALDVDLYR